MECGESDLNTVILHQGEQAGIPTSGISTSPYLPRAKYYALTGGKTNIGYVFQLSVKKPLNIDVTIYRVNDLIPHPAAHEDDDHILAANDCGRIPEIAIESISLVTNNT
ncbi:hypothetical protein [Teredinibacter haidensis]|uniref:hypothetical protein n=1 Tax=Teredinibacter haidensis TaxID=2731755 RepID=UPI0009F977A8|nr:hypothetical protein [Teredinibacter haidensis]